MMTLIARLCALCALCSLMQMAMGETEGQSGMRMIGGLLMIHLVISGIQELMNQLTTGSGLMHIFHILAR